MREDGSLRGVGCRWYLRAASHSLRGLGWLLCGGANWGLADRIAGCLDIYYNEQEPQCCGHDERVRAKERVHRT